MSTPWTRHLKKTAKANPGMGLGEVSKIASKSYKAKPAAKSKASPRAKPAKKSASKKATSEWIIFLKENGGKGHSREELSAMYKSRSVEPRGPSGRKLSDWHLFLKGNKGRGWTKDKFSPAYRADPCDMSIPKYKEDCYKKKGRGSAPPPSGSLPPPMRTPPPPPPKGTSPPPPPTGTAPVSFAEAVTAPLKAAAKAVRLTPVLSVDMLYTDWASAYQKDREGLRKFAEDNRDAIVREAYKRHGFDAGDGIEAIPPDHLLRLLAYRQNASDILEAAASYKPRSSTAHQPVKEEPSEDSEEEDLAEIPALNKAFMDKGFSEDQAVFIIDTIMFLAETKKEAEYAIEYLLSIDMPAIRQNLQQVITEIISAEPEGTRRRTYINVAKEMDKKLGIASYLSAAASDYNPPPPRYRASTPYGESPFLFSSSSPAASQSSDVDPVRWVRNGAFF